MRPSFHLAPWCAARGTEAGGLADDGHRTRRCVDILVLERRLARLRRRTQEACRRRNAGYQAPGGVVVSPVQVEVRPRYLFVVVGIERRRVVAITGHDVD